MDILSTYVIIFIQMENIVAEPYGPDIIELKFAI